MKSAVSNRKLHQPIGHAHQATSNMASISIAAFRGSWATPTVVRAWRPLSPRIATIKSEAPFITAGKLEKDGKQFTNPPSLKHRTIRVKSWVAFWACARRLIAHSREAPYPSFSDTLSPSLPVCSGRSNPPSRQS